VLQAKELVCFCFVDGLSDNVKLPAKLPLAPTVISKLQRDLVPVYGEVDLARSASLRRAWSSADTSMDGP
jgi:hypothetical protein